jgi:hypothetical protein
MYSAKILGNEGSSNLMSINHSNHKAAMAEAVKNKKQLPAQPKKK